VKEQLGRGKRRRRHVAICKPGQGFGFVVRGVVSLVCFLVLFFFEFVFLGGGVFGGFLLGFVLFFSIRGPLPFLGGVRESR